jgi:L-ascorbate metabolism protein UlaG (beta-lactamase superfamily)
VKTWRNITDFAKKSPAALRLAARLGRGQGRLRVLDHLSGPPPAPPLLPDLRDWQNHSLAAAWIGHSTVLLRIGGFTILTDPVFSHRIGLSLGVMTGGPRRLVAAAIPLQGLPPIDLILISHAHFDHLDRPTLRRLPHRTPIITAPRTRDLIRDLGFRTITELRWGQVSTIGDVKLTARKVVHWGARTFTDQHRGYNGYLIESGGRRVLYAGDTAYHEHFRDITDVDLAILGIGAYDPYIAAHATPEQTWAMANQMRAERLMAIHHSTFRLSHEPDDEPMRRLVAVAGRDADRIVASEIGATWVR